MSRKLARREFLKSVGVSAAAAACGCGEAPPADIHDNENTVGSIDASSGQDTSLGSDTRLGADVSLHTDTEIQVDSHEPLSTDTSVSDTSISSEVLTQTEPSSTTDTSMRADTQADTETSSSSEILTDDPAGDAGSNPGATETEFSNDTNATDPLSSDTWTGADASALNVLLITVDDMDRNSVGIYGCGVPEITPNIDRFASQGVRFEHGHVNISVCQPCRGVLATGRYSMHNGMEGFEHTTMAIPTVMQELKNAGYQTGIMAKVTHSTPHRDFPWDSVVNSNLLETGRSPELFYDYAMQFFEDCKAQGKPFYLMANSQDPHRPFFSARDETKPSRQYSQGVIQVPGYLPNLQEIRDEIATYFSSVRRGDDTVGAILQALTDSGYEDNTLVIFISDNGMSMPFSKANCYPASTKTPWIVRWPGVVEPGSVDDEHFVSTIDFMPTVLEATGLPLPDGMDGRSTVPLLRGERQTDRTRVFTQFHRTISQNHYPMRCVQDSRHCYIFNPWADGIRVFEAEALSGYTFPAMQAAAETDPEIASRVAMLRYRTLEEFYDLENDPHCLVNLIDDPAYQIAVQEQQLILEEWMIANNDDVLTCFENRFDGDVCSAYVQSLEQG